MAKEIRARYANGVLEPLEELELEEGREVIISVRELPSVEDTLRAIDRAFGAWAGTLDFDEFLRDMYASRRSQSPAIEL